VHPVLIHIGAIIIPSYGALAAIGVLLALFLAQRTARVAGLDPAQVWNLCVVALFTSLFAQRLLLVAVNLRDLRRHPIWLLTLAMVHHPLLATAGTLAGFAAAVLCARWQKLPLRATADTLASPLVLGMAFEQLGTLLAGSGYGTQASVPWAVTYTHTLAAVWSGTPLGTPMHPVQAYTALAFLALSVFLFFWQPSIRQCGDLAGLGLMGSGVIVYITEFWRDSEGRGSMLEGALDGPQIAGILMVLAGAVVLRERKGQALVSEAQHG
jgi:phosphatidylglycerol:prolipoprotein diacylglycerol transferase